MTSRYAAAHGRSRRPRQLVSVFVLICASALTLHGSSAGHRAHLSIDLLLHEARQTTAGARVIVHGTSEQISAIAGRHHLTVLRQMNGSAVLVADSAEITDLASDADVDHLSGDLPVRVTMSVSNQSTAADQVRAGVSGGLLGLGAIAGVSGQGVGVAVIDSGISPHAALARKVVANVSFVTGDTQTADVYGHGTHVAGIIAGSGGPALGVTPLYTGGIAPGAQLINVRVLGADGSGYTSDVIAGIDWVIAHRVAYNIRVVNLSLGHPVTEPAATDPLCEEVQKAVSAGIVVVVSAGNSGKAADGSPVLGGITSPGNSPFALTVGALNTWGTVARSDDSVTTYSSRGPTRYDLAVKPDVAAPGNKIISLEAAGSTLSAGYPVLHVAGSGSNAYMQLSGTSMAAPMVSGGVALLLQGNRALSPAQIKLALQSSATYVPEGGLVGAGAGSVNFWGARKIAANGLVASLVTTVSGLLTPASGASFWDAGTLCDRLYAGPAYRLLSLLDLAPVWANPSLLNFGDLNLVGGLLNPLQAIAPNPLIWGQVASWTDDQHIMWGDNIYDPQGEHIMWGDSDMTDDTHIMWGDAVLTSPDPDGR